MIRWYTLLAGPSAEFSEVILEHSLTFCRILMGIADLPAQPSIISRFSTLLGPQCHINTAIPSLHLSLSRSLRPVSPPFFPHWHNSKNNARVPPHQTPMREGAGVRWTDRERDRWRKRQRITVWVEIWLCIKAKLRGKNFLLNWLYIHEKKNHSVSLCRCVALSLCLSHGANCLHATSVYFYTLLSNPAFHRFFLLASLCLTARFVYSVCCTFTTCRVPKPVISLWIYASITEF